MSEPRTPYGRETETAFSRAVGAQAARKMRARRGGQRGTWFGLGLSGLIGWSVSTPTLIGTAVGIWIDKSYLQPTVIMLPFNIISEISRTLALAIRLFGNMMSGTMIVAILLTITPLVFPIIMSLLGLLTGMVQAYIFCILATVYIAAATRTRLGKHAAVTDHVP